MSSRNLDAANYIRYVRHAKKLPLTDPLHRLVNDLELDQYDTDDDRALAFIKKLYMRRVKWSTFKRYFYKLRPSYWPTSSILPSPRVFDLNNPPQNRDPDTDSIRYLVNELKNNGNKYGQPILMAYYTGLRSSEVARLQTSHLSMLVKRVKVIPLKRKIGVEWKVYYFTQFEDFIETLRIFYAKKLEAFERYGVEQSLFDMSTATINYKLRQFYMTICKKVPYPGFGLHVFRYYIATILENREVARMILDHKSVKTTDRYYYKVNYDKTLKRLGTVVDTDPVYEKLAS